MDRTRWIGAAAVALLVAGGGYWALERNIPPSTVAAGEKGHGGEGQGHQDEKGVIHLTSEQIGKAGIRIVEAGPGEVARKIQVTGTVVPDTDRMAHVTTRLSGVVAEIVRRVGETVKEGDLLVVLDSRELADAKSEYLTALSQEGLARTTLAREGDLWRKKVSAEQDYLNAKNAAETAKIALAAARQRLVTLGLSARDIEDLPKGVSGALSRLEVRAPIAGRITARDATRGELVAAEKEIFTVADLSNVWLDMPVYTADMPYVREGQKVLVKGANGQEATAEIVSVSPAIDPQTGAGRAIAALDNAAGAWRPGDFAEARIVTAGVAADVAVPAGALQTVGGETVVFVRTEEGFEKRVVEVGRANGRVVEVVFGLFPGDPIAASGTFVLKAEASRGEAEHSHSH